MLKLFVGRELPPWELFWLTATGQARDLSAGYTFSVIVRQAAAETVLSSPTIVANPNPTTDTGNAADVPTLLVTPALGALDNLQPRVPTSVIVIATATSGGRKLEQQWPAEVYT